MAQYSAAAMSLSGRTHHLGHLSHLSLALIRASRMISCLARTSLPLFRTFSLPRDTLGFNPNVSSFRRVIAPIMAETSQPPRDSPEVQEIDDTNMDMDIDENGDDKSADGQERTIDLPTNKRVDSFMLPRHMLIESFPLQ